LLICYKQVRYFYDSNNENKLTLLSHCLQNKEHLKEILLVTEQLADLQNETNRVQFEKTAGQQQILHQ
jgi:hypothetical protein